MSDAGASDRRQFVKRSVATGASVGLGVGINAQAGAKSAGVQRYRELGRTQLKISDISFGSSRLRRDGAHLVRHALDRGINYFDSAYGYSGGASETVLGEVFKGIRNEVILVSKVETTASWNKAQMMERLDESLRRLQTDYIDIYMTHAVNDIARLKSDEWFAFADSARAQGKIRFTGMSGHAGRLIPCLDYALDEDMVDVILCAYNFGQDPNFYERITKSFNFIANQPDLPRVLKKAKAKNVGVVAMKTLMGARLNDMRPYEHGNATFAQAAFRWVLSNTDVHALVVSMTSTEDIDEYLGASGASELALGDMPLLLRYAAQNGASYCRHACDDCAGACPFGVNIADVLRTRMYATDYEDMVFARDEYAMIDANAAPCLSCSGEPCRNACTHGIPINEVCGPTHQMLA